MTNFCLFSPKMIDYCDSAFWLIPFSTGNIADTDTYLMCMFAVYV